MPSGTNDKIRVSNGGEMARMRVTAYLGKRIRQKSKGTGRVCVETHILWRSPLSAKEKFRSKMYGGSVICGKRHAYRIRKKHPFSTVERDSRLAEIKGKTATR